MPLTRLAVGLVAATATAAPLECGVATTQFQQSPQTLAAAVSTGKLSFWWNWGLAPRVETSGLAPATVAAMNKVFVPMVWGQGELADYSFLKDASGDVMGYNEPDLYGPACCNCDAKQSYYAATSSGWLPLFNPASAANFWKSTVNELTSTQRTGTTLRRIVSPSMANGAIPAPGVDCTLDPSDPANTKRCQGWMALFKNETLQMTCTRFDGTVTNCWDVIDAIQIHSYDKSASGVLKRIDEYLAVFSEDFLGANGRSKKALWLTEVAAGYNEVSKVLPFVKELMGVGGLSNRSRYGAVARVSWFSEFFFPAFDVSGAPAKPGESWVSSLFDPYGGLNDVGKAFFANCASAAAP